MGFISEFKEFAVKGNVVDMAIGIIIGGAFGKIVSSFVSDIVMPPIGMIVGGVNFDSLKLIISEAKLNGAEVVTQEIAIRYGAFISTVLDFLIIAFAIFIAIRQMNRLKKKEEAVPAPPKQEVLLEEIRDLLKRQV